MTSKIKVDNINKVSDDSNIIKKCGTTTTIGSGASNPIVVDGSAVTLGRCGGTVALASGATQTGFGRTGTVDWDTTPKTATFTAVSGDGFFANTTGSAFNMNLPAGSAGAIVSVADYAATWQNNNLTVVPNGSDKIGGVNANVVLSTEGQSVTFIFVDSTQGWINTMDSTSNERGTAFICASVSGACNTLVTVDTNFKVATFTGPGTFTVNSGAGPVAIADYLVIAGGGGGSTFTGSGGGGAGGFREAHVAATSGPYTASPLAATSSLPISPGAFPITVGAGGAGSPGSGVQGGTGVNSIFSTITSTGGGGGGKYVSDTPGQAGSQGSPGGSGGGNMFSGPATGGVGNTPPVSPPQGNNGGVGSRNQGSGDNAGGGGGGASAAGTNGSPNTAGPGGNGLATSITGAAVTRGGGGGAGSHAGSVGTGGSGGGGTGTNYPSGTPGGNGTANTGGGGGGSGNGTGGTGGSGVVIIRYKFQ